MLGGLGSGLRRLQLGAQHGLAIAGGAHLLRDLLEKYPDVVGVIAAKARRERRTSDGIGAHARLTTLGVALGRHRLDSRRR